MNFTLIYLGIYVRGEPYTNSIEIVVKITIDFQIQRLIFLNFSKMCHYIVSTFPFANHLIPTGFKLKRCRKKELKHRNVLYVNGNGESIIPYESPVNENFLFEWIGNICERQSRND